MVTLFAAKELNIGDVFMAVMAFAAMFILIGTWWVFEQVKVKADERLKELRKIRKEAEELGLIEPIGEHDDVTAPCKICYVSKKSKRRLQEEWKQ